MTDETLTLKQAQAATVAAMRHKNEVVKRQRKELKPFSAAITKALAADTIIRRAQAKSTAEKIAKAEEAEAERAAAQADGKAGEAIKKLGEGVEAAHGILDAGGE